ncbi:MAG: hypothetical protein U0360_08360 [Dehalococcoidia bacterium]
MRRSEPDRLVGDGGHHRHEQHSGPESHHSGPEWNGEHDHRDHDNREEERRATTSVLLGKASHQGGVSDEALLVGTDRHVLGTVVLVPELRGSRHIPRVPEQERGAAALERRDRELGTRPSSQKVAAAGPTKKISAATLSPAASAMNSSAPRSSRPAASPSVPAPARGCRGPCEGARSESDRLDEREDSSDQRDATHDAEARSASADAGDEGAIGSAGDDR